MSQTAPDALLLMATGCAFCPAVLKHLQELEQSGDIAHLEAINISQQPDVAAKYGVRSVPFVKIGDIELTGTQTREELLKAIEQSQSETGLQDYYDGLLNNGQLKEAIEQLQKQPEQFPVLLELLQQADIKVSVQIGIGAIMEEFANSETLIKQIPALTELTHHDNARVRNDACFYLSLSGQPTVIDTIKSLLDDDDADVRETAQDCLDDFS